MQNSYWDFVPRRPRHVAAANSTVRVELLLPNSINVPLVAALHDFSRRGAQVSIGMRCEPGELLTLQLANDASGFSVALTGVVRWVRNYEHYFLVGCEFAEEVSWATLGELFLNEILAADLMQQRESESGGPAPAIASAELASPSASATA